MATRIPIYLLLNLRNQTFQYFRYVSLLSFPLRPAPPHMGKHKLLLGVFEPRRGMVDCILGRCI